MDAVGDTVAGTELVAVLLGVPLTLLPNDTVALGDVVSDMLTTGVAVLDAV